MMRRREPWTADEIARLIAVTLAAGMSVVAAWYLAAGRAEVQAQVGAGSLAIAGLLLYGYGNTVWLLRGMRATADRRSALAERLEQLATRGRSPTPGDGQPTTLVAGPGLRYYHRLECPLAAGRLWRSGTRADHEIAGHAPCGICRP